MAAEPMQTRAVVLAAPGRLALEQVELTPPGVDDLVVDIEWSGISTGTERLLYDGRMPQFPGMGYPLVPGYESVGRISAAPAALEQRIGERVFVPGARCYTAVRGLFGGAAARLIVPASRVLPVDESLGAAGVLLSLAATAWHALERSPQPVDLIVGHGVLGRLLARLAAVRGAAPRVWERNPARRAGAANYEVLAPEAEERRDYAAVVEASGDVTVLDALIPRLRRQGRIVLAGFYEESIRFAFAPAFMREVSLDIAAEFTPADLASVRQLLASGALSLDGLVTHCVPAREAPGAYRTAFADPECLKMVLDWRAA